VTLCVIAFCSFAVLATSLKVRAAKPGYSINNYLAITVPTIEGRWTNSTEWTDAEERELDGTLTVYFRLKYAWSGSTVYQYILVDFLNDTTDDAGDSWSLCFDAHHDDGGSPQTDDYRISVIGHSFSGLHVYKGTGSGWAETSDYTWVSDLAIVNDINPSPHLSTPHWIAEFRINSTWLSLLNNFDLRVTAYDESGGGNQVWPDSTSNVPNDWGETITKFTTIPEFPSAIILPLFMLATLLAVIAYRRKRTTLRLAT